MGKFRSVRQAAISHGPMISLICLTSRILDSFEMNANHCRLALCVAVKNTVPGKPGITCARSNIWNTGKKYSQVLALVCCRRFFGPKKDKTSEIDTVTTPDHMIGCCAGKLNRQFLELGMAGILLLRAQRVIIGYAIEARPRKFNC